MFGRRGIVIAVCSMAMTGSSLALAPHSSATQRPVVCTGQEYRSAGTGVGLVPKLARVESRAQYTCTTGPGEAAPATGHFVAFSRASCLGLDNVTAGEVVHYAGGRKSVIEYDSSSVLGISGLNVIRLDGKVTEGPGKGQAAHRTLAILDPSSTTKCLVRVPASSSAPRKVQLEIRSV
ncbi:hypothetical protein [Streptomyces syringium]|uniref:hypothetical protein n=1 Tax=Streptomyces syringium TaxID=76729 RepID=UPI003AB020DE